MNVLILEDEPLIAQGLEREVRAHFGARLSNLVLHDNVPQALAALAQGQGQEQIDLLLLDLHLHGADGYDLLRLAADARFQTIIVSAHAERSITAFEFGVLDFVAKPFSRERLHKALQRYTGWHTEAASLSVKKRGALEWIAMADIDHVQADGHYSNIVLCSGEQCFHDLPIDKLMALLPPHFLRVHRSYIVNSLGFKRLQIGAGGKYALDTQTSTGIPVSRSSYPALKQRLLG
ncbi:LytR/AlgR family response regulator transcription factor [Janthinobacterium kumbetense]|uniref:LytTR family DNA-binding domain-containing protein n=1 Tax=Janthinobacterium kumbetense TaxID=2950280 RepID=A0ABT0WWN6_9BURK|nr:LytTR family DNA-binding domain-containing protein [Janthinobacterium kumbetense]MCM2567663.1 LytTR family DNA-binding domain-containing protein [Janthinobacterium kumbetense]